jgi:molecular chaperone GrpE (heat shock protein)
MEHYSELDAKMHEPQNKTRLAGLLGISDTELNDLEYKVFPNHNYDEEIYSYRVELDLGNSVQEVVAKIKNLENSCRVCINADNLKDDDSDKETENGVESENEQRRDTTDCQILLTELKAEIQELKSGVSDSLKNLEHSVQDFSYKDKINKELHEELQKYRGGLRMEFVMPLLKSIIREYDRATQQHDFYLQKSQEEQPGELFAKLLKEFDIQSLSLLDLIDDYNITPFSPEAGADYSSKEHKVLKAIATEDADKDSKIEKCVACGFREIESGRLIRQAEVNIYRLTK